MKEKALKIAIVFIIVLVLTGCTSGNNNNNNTNEEKRLEWWGTVHDPEVIQPLLDEYHTLFPNITITYSNARWDRTIPRDTAAANYQSELDKTLTSGNAISIPDIFTIDSTWVGKYENHLQPAPADLFTPETFRSTFYPAVADNAVLLTQSGQEKIVGIPDYIDTLAIVYNNDMVISSNPANKVPNDWNEFRDLARSITTKSPTSAIVQAGFAGGHGDNVEFSAELFNLLMFQNDVSVVSPLGLPMFATNDKDDSLSALEFYKSFGIGLNRTWSEDIETFRNDSAAFLEKKVAMIAVPSWRYRELQEMNQTHNLGIDMRVAKIPQLAGQEKDMYWAEYFLNGVSTSRPNSADAWRFLYWLSQPEQLRKLNENTKRKEGLFGIMSPRRDMQGDLVDDQYLATFNEMLPDTLNWKMVNGLRVKNVFQELLNKAASSENLSTTESQISGIMSSKL